PVVLKGLRIAQFLEILAYPEPEQDSKCLKHASKLTQLIIKAAISDKWCRLGLWRGRRSRGATMDVGVWLRSLSLARYEAVFRENDINERVLSSLTLADLKEIGVDSVGHRR